MITVSHSSPGGEGKRSGADSALGALPELSAILVVSVAAPGELS